MLVLASQSPRRKELLSKITSEFIIVPSLIEEIVPKNLPLEQVPAFLAKEKALDVLKQYPNDIVIGSDTIVSIDNQILGKPKSKEDAFTMLKSLSNKTHLVITGVCIASKEKVEVFSHISKVTFFELSDEMIQEYLQFDEYIGKAGSYAIQGKSALFIKNIEGDYYSIMGLPISLLNKKLKQF